MNLQESIKRILREETKPPLYFRRRTSDSDIERLVRDVKISISGGKSKSDALYDAVQNFISSNKEHFKDYMWTINHLSSLLEYINSRLNDEPLNESILREDTNTKKTNLVIKMIYSLYDEVSFIEQSTFNGKPLLIIYFDSDDTAVNIESWFDEKISRDIDEMTSGKIVVCPDWVGRWDNRKKNADVFINTELLKYDDLGNVINESELKEERELSTYFKRRLDMGTLEQIYVYALKAASKRYTDNKKRLNAMTPYKFNHMVTSELIQDVCENFELQCNDDGFDFNGLWDFLNDLYSKRNLKQFYEIR